MTYVQLATKHTKKSRQDSHCTERINLSKLDSNLLMRLANNELGREKPTYS